MTSTLRHVIAAYAPNACVAFDSRIVTGALRGSVTSSTMGKQRQQPVTCYATSGQHDLDACMCFSFAGSSPGLFSPRATCAWPTSIVVGKGSLLSRWTPKHRRGVFLANWHSYVECAKCSGTILGKHASRGVGHQTSRAFPPPVTRTPYRVGARADICSTMFLPVANRGSAKKGGVSGCLRGHSSARSKH